MDSDRGKTRLSERDRDYIANMLRGSAGLPLIRGGHEYVAELAGKPEARTHASDEDKEYVIDLMKKYKSEEYAALKKGEYMQEAFNLYMEGVSAKEIPDNNYSNLIMELFSSYAFKEK